MEDQPSVGGSSDQANIRDDLSKLIEVSILLDFPFSLDEIASYFLPNRNMTGNELKQLISREHPSDVPFQIEDGYLFANSAQSGNSRIERENISSEKLNSATGFARILQRLVPFIRTVAVTGSVAYGSAEKWDDIDLFVVTDRKRLWLSVFLALSLVRIWKAFGLRPSYLSSFCLSYVHDQEGFIQDSRRNRTNPLFARELLVAKTVAGRAEYVRLLEENKWTGNIYRRPYVAKLRELSHGSKQENHQDATGYGVPSFLLDWANGIMFAFLGSYLKLRAHLTNIRLKSQNQELRIFEPKITPNSCVYTSNFYRWLHALWGER